MEQKTNYFIKTTVPQPVSLSAENKVFLNRKGNVFFNSGDIEAAKRIFITTGYSDGLTRVGDVYFQKKLYIDALKMYVLAHNERKSAPLARDFAEILRAILREKQIFEIQF